MHDFGNIAYLDVHKTGSTFVSQFLDSCCILAPLKFSKHDWVRQDYRSDCFYFITIRNPYDMWSSLYRFGLDKKGDVFDRLSKVGLLDCYQSFEKFVNFCLDEENGNLLGYDFSREISERVGFMSFRFMKLSLQFPMEQINQCIQDGLSLDTLEPRFITKLEIKNENLNKELMRLSLDVFPEYFDVIKVKNFFENNSLINESQTPITNVDSLSDDTLVRMWSKEWLLMSRY